VRGLRLFLLGAALTYFFDPDNGKKRRQAATKRLAELRSKPKPPEKLADDLVGQVPHTA
jgi:uncharacterized protein (DUF58 family)